MLGGSETPLNPRPAEPRPRTQPSLVGAASLLCGMISTTAPSCAGMDWHWSERGRKVLGWPKICKFAHAFLWEYIDKRLKLAQLLSQVGVFLTWMAVHSPHGAKSRASVYTICEFPRNTIFPCGGWVGVSSIFVAPSFNSHSSTVA